MMNPIYSRRVKHIPLNRMTRRMYKAGSLFMGKSKQPDYRWVQTALKAAKKRKRKRKRRRR